MTRLLFTRNPCKQHKSSIVRTDRSHISDRRSLNATTNDGPFVHSHGRGARPQHDDQLRPHVHAVGSKALALRGRDRRAVHRPRDRHVRSRPRRAPRGAIPGGVRAAGGAQRHVGLRDDGATQRVARDGPVVRLGHDGESICPPPIDPTHHRFSIEPIKHPVIKHPLTKPTTIRRRCS